MIRKAFLNLISDIYSIAEETSSIENVLFNLRLKGIGKNNIRERKKIARLGFLFLWSTKILMLPILIVTYFKSFILSLFISLIPYIIFNILSFSNFLLLIFLIWAACNYKSVSISGGLFFFDLLEFISGGKLFDKFTFFYNDLPVEKKRNFIKKGNYFFITHLYSIKQVWGSPREARWEDYFTSISIKCADDPELLELETNKYWSEYSKPNNLFSHRNPPSLDRPDLWRDDDAWKIMTPAALKIILKNNENINEYDNASFSRRTMLCIAVVNDTSIELVKMLTDAGADVLFPQLDYFGREFSILESAVAHSSAAVVKHLILCGADVNSAAGDGFYPSNFVGPHNFFEIAVLAAKEPQILREILLTSNQDFLTDMNANTLLHYAAISPNNRSEYVKVLLDFGFDINVKNSSGQTPLIFGLSNCPDERYGDGSTNLETMKFLLRSGANPNTCDQLGNSALHCISNFHYILDSVNERVSELLLSGADIDALNLYGYTPLICAAFVGHHEVVESLINHEANIEFVSDTGLTAFEAACLVQSDLIEFTSIPNYVQIIDLFLKAGVNLNQTFTQTGKKPIDLISERLSGMKDFSIEDLPKESMLARHLRDN